jgi:hypothetical protein
LLRDLVTIVEVDAGAIAVNDGAADGISTGDGSKKTAVVGASDDGAGTVSVVGAGAATIDSVGVAGVEASVIDYASAGASDRVGEATGSSGTPEDDGVT